MRLLMAAAIGGGLGAVLGYFGQCSSGTCPLTSTWWRGVLYGGVIGMLLSYASGGISPAAMNESTPNVKHIKQNQFESEVAQATVPVVVDFYATWCGPCKILSPRLDKLAGSITNGIRFVKVNIDEAPALVQRFGIQGVPTLMFFNRGKIVDSVTGLPPMDVLKARLASLAEANEIANQAR